jgi:hypothetical protein
MGRQESNHTASASASNSIAAALFSRGSVLDLARFPALMRGAKRSFAFISRPVKKGVNGADGNDPPRSDLLRRQPAVGDEPDTSWHGSSRTFLLFPRWTEHAARSEAAVVSQSPWTFNRILGRAGLFQRVACGSYASNNFSRSRAKVRLASVGAIWRALAR